MYHDLKVDYSSVEVNATNFLSVLAGDADAMKGIGTGRVVASGPHDRVFVYYTDHGAPGAVLSSLCSFARPLFNQGAPTGAHVHSMLHQFCSEGSS